MAVIAQPLTGDPVFQGIDDESQGRQGENPPLKRYIISQIGLSHRLVPDPPRY